MVNTRQKDQNWRVSTDGNTADSLDHVQLAVLMDIRDELKQLNRVFSCPNAQAIPSLLRRISANTANLPKRPPKRVDGKRIKF